MFYMHSTLELDNVKMFGDLPLETASKLLEENDFQDVFSKLPDEAFDLFTSRNSNYNKIHILMSLI